MVSFITAAIFAASALPSIPASLGTKVLKGAAIGFVVKEAAGPLDSFINKVTIQRGMPNKLSTKVVPILSVGDKGYIGGAQVSGPAKLVKDVQAVFQYEQNFDNGRYRIKVLLPSSSLNPIQLKRVQKVGVTAIIDVALDGGLSNNYYSGKVGGGEILRAAAVAVGVNVASKQLNSLINTITFNNGVSTKVVPMASFGEKAYIGGCQVSGSAASVKSVAALWQYEDLFSNGKFRIKVMVPTNSINPLKMKRVYGAGITAVIDTSVADQQTEWEHDQSNRTRSTDRPRIYRPGDNQNRDDNRDDRHHHRDNRDDNRDDKDKKDNGKHKGWYKGKHKGWDQSKLNEKFNIFN